MLIKINRKFIGYLWLSVLGLGLLAYIFFPQTFNIANLISVIHNYYRSAVFVYFIFICFRGLLLISPLPMTLASSVFFSPLVVLLVNSLGILISSVLVYRFSEFLGFDEYFEKNYHQQIEKIKKRLDKKEIPIIFAWSFLPLLPTDLIIYISASLKIPLWKCLAGVFLGTLIINALFIYSLNFFLPSIN
ncbi:MAG: VTT domain-containing protein [Candidatus Falkowbacteria bacterium]